MRKAQSALTLLLHTCGVKSIQSQNDFCPLGIGYILPALKGSFFLGFIFLTAPQEDPGPEAHFAIPPVPGQYVDGQGGRLASRALSNVNQNQRISREIVLRNALGSF